MAIGFVFGGAVGNLIDRARFGAVVDFVDVHWHGWHWPAFNVADSAITVGVALLALASSASAPPRRPASLMDSRALVVSAETAGERLDRWLAAQLRRRRARGSRR